jgi:hypothetical protein
MGQRTTINGVTISRPIDIANYPISRGLKSLFLLGTDSNYCKTNRAPGGADASTPGASITHQEGYSTFTSSESGSGNKIFTADYNDDSQEVTKLALAVDLAQSRSLYAAYPNTTATFVLGNSDGRIGKASAGPTIVGYAGVLPTYETPPLVLRAASWIPSEALFKVRRVIDGVVYTASAAAPDPRGAGHTQEIIGGSEQAAFVGEARIGAVAKHHVGLTDDEFLSVYAYFKFHYKKNYPSLVIA